MKTVIILKHKDILSDFQKEEMVRKIQIMIDDGVIVLDNKCNYEIATIGDEITDDMIIIKKG